MLVAVVVHPEDITASALSQSKTSTTNLGHSTGTQADTNGGERLLRSAPDAKDSVVDAEERGALSTLTKKFSELKTKAVNSVKTSWWASIEKSDDTVLQKLGLTGLSGSKLTSDPRYKVYLQFRYKAEGKMLNRMLDNEVPPSDYWSDLGLTLGPLTKAQFTNLKKTDEFKSYIRYAEKYDDEVFSYKNTMFEYLMPTGGYTAEYMAKQTRCIASVQVTHDTGLPDLIITPLAAQKLMEAAERQKAKDLMLRVAVEGGGCSGFKYVYEFEKDAVPDAEEDIVFEQHGGKVVVDKESLEFIRGSTVDFEQELIRSAFAIINNPNAASGCGCGSSFDLKD
ncbi:Iron-sulfur cluster assembly 2, mitochondrial [Phytophthora boehmeriae]|uniref:RxLR effector protein n=1 Tax=Phytophthora boehmeriae TaxID=109152 RepID=A0A8T1WK09_9STRA|nr:Iron-sulfur cluster assembly 2, mitochondrial [Phytophthora boehmeriae]